MSTYRAPAVNRRIAHCLVGGTVVAGAWQVWQRVVSMATFPPFAQLIGRLVTPEPGMSVYDPSAGVGTLLAAARRATSERYGLRARPNGPPAAGLDLFAQELDPIAFTIGRAALTRTEERVRFARGDTLRSPAYVVGSRLQTFDVVVANPVWEQSVEASVFQHDPFDRFAYGIPPVQSADWAWVQHCLASMNSTARAAIVLDVGALSRKDTSSEPFIRQAILEDDLVEAVICCSPDTRLPTAALDRFVGDHLRGSAIMILNRTKRAPGKVLMVDATAVLVECRMRPLATLSALSAIYHAGQPQTGASLVEVEHLIRGGSDLQPTSYL